MKKIKFTILFITLLSFCSCSTSKQTITASANTSLVERNGNDVIFNKNYVVAFELTNFKNRYTPSVGEIESVKALVRSKNIWNDSFPENSSINQYLGFIDASNHRFVVIQIVNNSNPRKVKKLLGDNWEYDFVVTLSDEFYSISNRFKIDIDKKSLSNQL